MDEAPKSIEIEINAPAQDAVFTGTPQIAGDTATPQLGGDIPLSDNVVYSMGPDGQLVAIEKPPFSWKQFGIGAGVPSLLLLLPVILLLVIMSSYEDPYVNHSKTISKESGTYYSLEIEYPESLDIYWCDVYDIAENDQYYSFSCEVNSDNITFLERNLVTDEERSVGSWSAENGLIEFDTGRDHGESFRFFYDTYDHELDDDQVAGEVFSAITGIMCFVAPITALVLLIVGFSTDRKSLGFGGVAGLVLYPVIAFFGFIALLEWGW